MRSGGSSLRVSTAALQWHDEQPEHAESPHEQVVQWLQQRARSVVGSPNASEGSAQRLNRLGQLGESQQRRLPEGQ